MTLEGFVRATGAAMGLARDAFGTGAAGEAAPADMTLSAPGGPFAGTGRAAEAAGTEAGQLSSHAAALSERNSTVNAQLANALKSQAVGRARMDGIIDSATADVHALAPASTTPHGQRAMVAALTRHLQATRQTLQDGQAEATTHAAATQTTAASYHGVAASPAGMASASPTSLASAASMGATPLAGLSGLPGVMGLPGAAGRGSSGQQTAANTAGTDGSTIDAVVSRALAQHGTPYSWGGGGKTGPGPGDDGTVGFDCSSLMQYAYAGAGVDLPRTTYAQIGLGQPVSPGDVRAGDLIFSNFGEGGTPGPGHVQLAISSTHVVEAPHTGTSVQVTAMPAGHVVVRRILH